MCHLICISSHSTQPTRGPPFSPLSICCLKMGHRISRRNCSQKISVRQICCQSPERRPFYVGRVSCWRRQGENFLIFIFNKWARTEVEAVWITQAGRAGRWNTKVLLISRLWTCSGRTPYTPPPPLVRTRDDFEQIYYWLEAGSRSLEKPGVAGGGMTHQQRRVKISISQSCL